MPPSLTARARAAGARELENVRAALARAAAAIAAGGCETPRLDAEVLLAQVLGVRRERLHTDSRRELSAAEQDELAELVRRRARLREPIAYIVGRRAFRNIELLADARALVPRPETELLIECALSLPYGARVLDVGTGTGAVALALKSERSDLRVSASDVSGDALALAAENGARLRLEVAWLRADLLSGVPDEFDAILANLPYVADSERGNLAPEIVRHEPATALYGGPEGTELIAALAAQLRRRPGVRMAALEVGAEQARRVRDLLSAAGFARVRALRDLAGIDRVVIAEARI